MPGDYSRMPGFLGLKKCVFLHYSKYLTVDSSLSAVFFVSLRPNYVVTARSPPHLFRNTFYKE